jgi:ribosome-associated toxin RatA of RatAB toxin-antitoxin module
MMTGVVHTRIGGCTRIRRFVFNAMTVCVVALTSYGTRAAADSSGEPTVIVREDHGVYSVTARLLVPQSPSTALAVLTDYERIPQFMPGVETSRVLERGSGRAVIAQDAVSRLMMFTKRVHLELEVVEGADTLHFRDRSGRSFVRYEGTWRLCGEEDGTHIAYDLVAQPSFDVPQFVLKRLLKRDSAEMIQRLRQEIATRSGPSHGPTATDRH